MNKTVLVMAMALAAGQSWAASTLDTVVQAKVLRCGVMLDSPPSGYRTADNQPAGYDVAYCDDLAKALGARAEIVETPSPDRIPALVSNRIDVLVASTTNSTARGLSVAFSQPYLSVPIAVLTREGSGIRGWDDLKGHALGGVTGTTTEQFLKMAIGSWKVPSTHYVGYGNDNDSYVALEQGKVDAILLSVPVSTLLIRSGQFPHLQLAGMAPMPPDLLAIAVKRGDTEFLNWTRLFVWNQVASGRYKTLYNQYFAPGDAPSLSIGGVDY
ncbi:transporter substrate-binding domain-containing protein [Pseudomonas typographi]|uniref:Transporter substrate-binding domain-containing protein n=1 Tax=Pseudomonas typographi TaxID=2715964 RepID=A0ABR7Z7P4_9PSED|nr:transporter substrate-binding domain-containing protein [Pseudomonas typographi]MBD1601343.1 transporter substrate-binding domain-containing protein [Pseudomonas typographi]